MTKTTDPLGVQPIYLRATIARGAGQVDRTGGMFGAGLIRGVSLLTQGEALGHGFWLDEEFQSDVTEALNDSEKGIKARFTHPSLSSDGTGKYLGRFVDGFDGGTSSVAELHLSKASRSTPEGDLGGYVMDLAEEDPEAFGVSIVFEANELDQEEFLREHSKSGSFVSPDPRNTEHLPHAKLGRLRAADVVDDPAANPGGLFYREQQFAAEGDQLLQYACGLTEERPTTSCLSIDAERGKQFLHRFLSNHGLEIRKMDKDTKTHSVSYEVTTTDLAADEANPVDDKADSATEALAETEQEEATQLEADPAVHDPKRFLDEYGEQGAVWFCEGKSFEEATKLYFSQIREENEQLKQKLSAIEGANGEEEPLEFSSDEKRNKPKGLASVMRVPSSN